MSRTASFAGLLVAGLLAGCEGSMPVAREQAARRWNLARAEIKAKLAADRLQAGNVAAAAQELAQADRLDPERSQRAALRAKVWLAEGKLAQAAGLLEQTHLEGQDQAEIEYLLGVVRQQQQRWDEALAAFLRAAELDPQEVTYLVAAAQTWLQLGQAEEALTLLNQHAAQFQGDASYQATVAECYEQLENWSAAAAAWARLPAPPELSSGIRARQAEALYRAGRYADAAAVFQELLDNSAAAATAPETEATPDPVEGDRWLRLMLIDCYLAQDQYAAAAKQSQILLLRNSNDVDALRRLARARAQQGQYVEALQVARRALGADRQDRRTLELVLALAWRVGDRELVSATAAALRQADPDNPLVRAVELPGR